MISLFEAGMINLFGGDNKPLWKADDKPPRSEESEESEKAE